MLDGDRSLDAAPSVGATEAPTRRERRFVLGVTVAWGAFLLYLGLARRLPIVGDVDSSKFAWWGHALGTMVLTALVYLVLVGRGGRTRRQIALLAFAIAVAGGALLEVLQAIGGARDPTIVDVLVDAAGAVLAVMVLSSKQIARRTAARVVSVGTLAMLVIGVPLAIFGTPPADSHVCDLQRIAANDPSTRGSASVRQPLAEYTFDERSGDTVGDVAASALPLQLRGRTSWIESGGLQFAGGAARSESSAAEVVGAIRASGEMTVIARVRTRSLEQNGPTRIVTISSGTEPGQVDMHLGQERQSLSVRLRATCGEFTSTMIPNVFTSTRRAVDLAVTLADGVERVYADGTPVAAWRLHGTLRNWQPRFPLVVGNEATMDRPFIGDVFGVAVYDRALTGSAIAKQTGTWPG